MVLNYTYMNINNTIMNIIISVLYQYKMIIQELWLLNTVLGTISTIGV